MELKNNYFFTIKRVIPYFFILFTVFAQNFLISSPTLSKEDQLDKKDFIDTNPYILGPGDILNLTIYGEPELSGQLKILNDGTIPIPYSGNVFISGMSINSATDYIKTKLGNQLISPTLQLKIIKARPIRVSVIGEIQRPGLYSLTNSENSQTTGLTGLNISGLPTVVDAIQKAGGITQNADLRKVELVRRIANTKNEYKKTNLDLWKLISNGEQNFNPYLFDGDIVKINKSSLSADKIVSISNSNLSPQNIFVNIIGEVETPGKKELISNTPLIQAISAAGGPKNWRSNRGKVLLVRLNKNGTVSRKRYNINLNENVSNRRNPVLKSGDTIVVARSALAVGSDALSAVTSPLSNVITAVTFFKLIGD